jgi:hypothetical protein
MIPLQVGIDVDLKIIGAEVGIGPTLTFNTRSATTPSASKKAT